MTYRILVLGGYGQFGRRIVRSLATEPQCHVVIAGRHLAQAEAMAIALQAEGVAATVVAVALDTQAPDFVAQLTGLRPDLVIHTAGPFLDRGYSVARQCIAADVNYIDLADNREFVLGIDVLNSEAQAKGVLVVSGASTVPALSAAVVDHFRGQFARIDHIDIGITPGSRAPRGRSTIESVLAYCGKPYRAWQKGSWMQVFGWQNLRRVRYPQLGNRWFANCNIPDLEMFPQRYQATGSVSFGAALELRSMQFSVWGLSWLARAGVIRNWQPFAGLLKSASDLLLHFGTDRGGMHVHVDGFDAAGKSHRVRWFLIAQHGDGPMIPCMASIILARKLIRGELMLTGARRCVDMLTLEEFEAAMHGLDIRFECEH